MTVFFPLALWSQLYLMPFFCCIKPTMIKKKKNSESDQFYP